MQEYHYNFPSDDQKRPTLPSFTFSHTLPVCEPGPVWVPAAEAVKELERNGVTVSKQTLFVHEQAGQLKTNRISARKVLFNLQEVLIHFKAKQPIQ